MTKATTTRKAKAATIKGCPCLVCTPRDFPNMPEKYIDLCRADDRLEWYAFYQGEMITVKPYRSYLAADLALIEHKNELLSHGLIPTQHELQADREEVLAA